MIEGKANSAYGDTEMFELGLTLAPRVLALTPRPDGIVAINDALGIGLMVDCAPPASVCPQTSR